MADSPAEHDPEATTLGEHAASMADPGSARAALNRGRFLSGVTVGLGGLMSAVIAAPALGFVLAPAFETEQHYDVDLGPTSLYPVDKSNPFHVVTFTRSPKAIPTSIAASRSSATTAATSSRRSRTPACTSAAPCGRSARPASAAPAMVASTTPRAAASRARRCGR